MRRPRAAATWIAAGDRLERAHAIRARLWVHRQIRGAVNGTFGANEAVQLSVTAALGA